MKKLKDLLKESNYLKYKEYAIQKHEGVDDDQRTKFLEAVKLYKEFADVVYKKEGLKEVYENIRHIVEIAGKMTIDETEQWFDGVTVSRHVKRMNESFKLFEKTLKEMYPLQQRLESTYDEIGEVLGKYYEINELEEGNEFGAARAKAIAAGEDEFEVDGKTFPVKSVGKDDKANAKKFASESLKEAYNGWTNWDTWNANNWLTNDESSYKTVSRARDGKQVKKVFLQLFGKNKDDINVNKVDWDEIHDGLNESVNEAKSIKKGNTYYVDSDFVNDSKKGGKLHHSGFGDFEVDVKGGGLVSFIRVSEKMPGFSGRTHRVVGSDDDFKKLSKLMGVKSESVSESTKLMDILKKKGKSINEAAKKRFDVDFYKGNGDRQTSHEEMIRGDKFSDIVSQATEVAKSKGMNYVEFHYKDSFIGSIDKRNGYKFKNGSDYQKSPLSVSESTKLMDSLKKKGKSINEDYASRTVAAIGDLTGVNKSAIQTFIDKHNLDTEKLYQYIKKAKYQERKDFARSLPPLGKDGNPIQKKIIKMFSESVNEGLSPFKTSVKDGGMKDLIGKYKQHSKSSDTKKRREVYLQLIKVGQKFQFKQHDWKTLGRVSGAGEDAFKPKYIKQFGESTNEQGLTFHKSTFGKSVNEAEEKWSLYVDFKKVKEFSSKRAAVIAQNKYMKSNDDWERVGIQLGESTNESTKLTDLLKKKVESVNEAKKLSNAKVAMLGSKILRKIKIGTQFHTDSGVYTVTGFGRKSNAFQEFDASKSGDDSWKVKLSAMYGVKFEVNDDRRSAVFRKEERLNSIVLESVNKSTKLTDIYKKKGKSVNEAKYDIGMAMKGSGITVYNRAEEEAGDYKNIAHIKTNGMVTYYDKKLPKDIKAVIEKKAQSMK